MKRIRVNQLAKELGVPSQAILDRCRQNGLGDKVPYHMSVLSVAQSELVRRWFLRSNSPTRPLAATKCQPTIPSRRTRTQQEGRSRDVRVTATKPTRTGDDGEGHHPLRLSSSSSIDGSPPSVISPGRTIDQATAAPRHGMQRAVSRSGNRFVIDGMNVIRHLGEENPRLEFLLTMLIDVARNENDFICIIDAPAEHDLRKYQSERYELAYRALIKKFPNYFIKCARRTSADPLILVEAALRDAVVISNDSFSIFYKDFPSIIHSDRIREEQMGRIRRFNIVRDHLHVNERVLTLVGDLDQALDDLASAICSLAISHPARGH